MKRSFGKRLIWQQGQTFLVLVFLIGGLVAATAITFASLSLAFGAAAYGFQASVNAEAAATAGAEDALLQLARNGYYSSTGYNVTSASTTATVVVTNNATTTGVVTIVSTATVSQNTKTINVTLNENATTTQLNLVSWLFTQ